MTRWRRGAASTVGRFHVFDVHRLDLVREDGSARPVFTFSAPDWCNVVPLTDDGKVVLVRQHRWGTDAASLEIPGGIVDPGEAPLDAARRELREETGYDAGELVSLGAVDPNPALQGNRLHMFLARGCRPSGVGQQLDELEDCELVLLDRSGLDLHRGARSRRSWIAHA
ncbi:MAG: hypothetical protein NVS3B10_12830 [Polyangiales bacterium]